MAIDSIGLSKLFAGGCRCGKHHPEMYIHANCHPDSTLAAAYNSSTAVLRLECAECNALILEIKVERPQ
jgi:hypothetical protein